MSSSSVVVKTFEDKLKWHSPLSPLPPLSNSRSLESCLSCQKSWNAAQLRVSGKPLKIASLSLESMEDILYMKHILQRWNYTQSPSEVFPKKSILKTFNCMLSFSILCNQVLVDKINRYTTTPAVLPFCLKAWETLYTYTCRCLGQKWSSRHLKGHSLENHSEDLWFRLILIFLFCFVFVWSSP